jgi:hypothetical protein
MAKKQARRIIEMPTEVRQAEPGPSVLAGLLTIVACIAVLILCVVWFAFFRIPHGTAVSLLAQ